MAREESPPWTRLQILRAPCFVNGNHFDSVALAAIEFELDLNALCNAFFLGSTLFGEDLIHLQNEEEEYDRIALGPDRWKAIKGREFIPLPVPTEEVVLGWIGKPMQDRVIPLDGRIT